MTRFKEKLSLALLLFILIYVLSAGNQAVSHTPPSSMKGIPPNVVADYLQAIIQADREVYTSRIVERLQSQGVVLSSEDWETRHGLILPNQFLREAAALVAERNNGIRYRLISLWPIYERNLPATMFEKQGLEAVGKNPDKSYTGIAKSGKKQFFQAIYADRAISEACVECHNTHPQSPKRDFQLQDVMGGLVITIPLT